MGGKESTLNQKSLSFAFLEKRIIVSRRGGVGGVNLSLILRISLTWSLGWLIVDIEITWSKMETYLLSSIQFCGKFDISSFESVVFLFSFHNGTVKCGNNVFKSGTGFSCEISLRSDLLFENQLIWRLYASQVQYVNGREPERFRVCVCCGGTRPKRNGYGNCDTDSRKCFLFLLLVLLAFNFLWLGNYKPFFKKRMVNWKFEVFSC